jgi:hypothetical protein
MTTGQESTQEGYAMRCLVFPIGLAILAATAAGMRPASADPVYVDQGPQWTQKERADFYSHDQGSRLIHLSWLKALKTKDGKPFLADSMSRYGFLPNPDSSQGLPVGFLTTGAAESELVGANCSSCHTRQIEVAGKAYRIDGGPSLSDYQAFLADLDKAVGDALASNESFAAFAAAVTPPPADVAALRQRVEAWYQRYHAWASATLPPGGWGIGRLDAVGIIFNRMSGTDVGPPPSRLIPENMRYGDAAVRYPFLWNSPTQALTDWSGFVLNGNDVFALSRNTGQALSFADFQPKPWFWFLFSYANTINFDGVTRTEELLHEIGPPKWPKEWPLDQAIAKKGEVIYKQRCSDGCHEKKDLFSWFKPLTWITPSAWVTPVQNVGTDTHQFDELAWKVKTGVMEGAGIPLIARRLEKEDFGVHMMFSAVAGSIAAYKFNLGKTLTAVDGFGTLPPTGQAPPQVTPGTPPTQPPTPDELTIESGTVLSRTLHKGAYEARVLEGIWAAAPYLHNGSVPTMAELLTPPAQRKTTFALGPKYDINNIGLAETQEPSSPSRTLTGCEKLNSGDSNCGHTYGTDLSSDDKKALLEYLKTL